MGSSASRIGKPEFIEILLRIIEISFWLNVGYKVLDVLDFF